MRINNQCGSIEYGPCAHDANMLFFSTHINKRTKQEETYVTTTSFSKLFSILLFFFIGLKTNIRAAELSKPAVTKAEKEKAKPSTTQLVIPNAFFSPHIKDFLVKLIDDETRSYAAAYYRFYSVEIVKAILRNNKDKKLAMTFVLDRDYKNAIKSKKFNPDIIKALTHRGARVYRNRQRYKASNNYEAMHHKYFMFGRNALTTKPVLVTGSFNCTDHAHSSSWENIIILDDPHVIEKYEVAFNELVKNAILITDENMLQDDTVDYNGLAERAAPQVIVKVPAAYFHEEIKPVVLQLLSNEKKGIRAACDIFSHLDLSKGWIEAKEKHKHTCGALIIDKRNYKDNLQEALHYLRDHGVEVAYPLEKSLMHHKFILFEKNLKEGAVLITGSGNYSGQSFDNNWEDAVVINDPDAINKFLEEWNRMYSKVQQLSGADLNSKLAKSNTVKAMNGIPIESFDMSALLDILQA